MKNSYGKTNNYRTKEDRMWILSAYRKKLPQLLNKGFNPFEDNSELYHKHSQKSKNSYKEHNVKSEEVEMTIKGLLILH